jgi:hypothetical protein
MMHTAFHPMAKTRRSFNEGNIQSHAVNAALAKTHDDIQAMTAHAITEERERFHGIKAEGQRQDRPVHAQRLADAGVGLIEARIELIEATRAHMPDELPVEGQAVRDLFAAATDRIKAKNK